MSVVTARMIKASLEVALEEDYKAFANNPTSEHYVRLKDSMIAWQSAHRMDANSLTVMLAGKGIQSYVEVLSNEVKRKAKAGDL